MSVEEPGLRDRRHASRRAVRSRRLLWLGPIALAMVLLLAAATIETARRQARAVGVSLEETEHGLVIAEVARGPARRAGVRTGDLVLRVAGREVADLADYDEAASTFSRGARIDFEVRRDGAKQLLEVQPGRPFPWLKTIIEWLACLGYLALGGVALVQLPGDLRARLLMLISISVALELAMPVEILNLPEYAFFAAPFLTLLIGLQIGLELHLAASIPDRTRFGPKRRWLVPGFYVAGGALGLQLAAALVLDATGRASPWSLAQAELLFWDVGGVLWALSVVALLASAVVRCPEPLSRQQTLLILLAVLPWSIHMVASVVAAHRGLAYPEWLEVVEPLVLLVYPLCILLAILRYRLFDLELVVKRSLVYTLLTSMLVLGFYAAIGAGGAFLSRLFPGGDTSIWLVGLATLTMGLFFRPLRRATQELIDGQFFPERAALRERLVLLASELPARGNLQAMGRELVDRLCDLFGLEAAAVLLKAESGILAPLAWSGSSGRAEENLLLSSSDPALRALQSTGRPLPVDHLIVKSRSLEDRLRPMDAAVLVPLLRRDELVGVLVLGRKLGGRAFAAEEMELLNLLSHHVATAFEYSQLYESATRDSLTGMLRRGAVLDALNRELDRSIRFGRPLALAMADLDCFKRVNDRHGHLKGDLVLKRVGRAITSGLRATDEVGRYGGEEFLVVLPETDAEGAEVVAEKVRGLVEEVCVTADNGEEIRVTISIGVVAIDQYSAASSRPEVNQLIAAADAALYRAKTNGRNRVEVRTATG